jgi:CubicO group peptidase (beta-lactamase class C family)
MKKRILKSLLWTVLVLLLIILLYLNYIGQAVTGYSAKGLASGIFLSGRTQESIEKEDINFSMMKFTKNRVDYDKKEVISRFLLWKSKAVYNEGLGCTLVRDFSEDAVKNMDYPVVPLLQGNPDTIAWPAGDLISDTIPTGINMSKLQSAIDQAFADTGSFRGTFGVAVVYKDQLVAERYRKEFTSSTRFLSWSMAKSFTNAMIGILVKEGKVNIQTPGLREEWANDERRNITLNNLMHMNSGLEFNEQYSTLKLTDVTTMLLKKGDMADFAVAKKLQFPPDSVWNYSGGSTNIVCEYIRTLLGSESEYFSFPRKALFNKIGMRSAVWEPDASGTFVGSSYIYATIRDYARFGLLYLNGGNWLGEQLLPQDWVNYTTTPGRGSEGNYGAFFYLNHSGRYPGVPPDMFSCEGHDGQFIYIIPSLQLVVVRNGYSPSGTYDFKDFLRSIVDCIGNEIVR